MVAKYMPITPSFKTMFKDNSNVINNLAVSLLTHYSFDLGGYGASELVKRWEKQFPSNWVHLAIIEALYQGRYKAVSVQQILNLWLRRNHPSYHFNLEFERLICNKLPENLKWDNLPPALPPVSSKSTIKEAMREYRTSQAVESFFQRNNKQQQETETQAGINDYQVAKLESHEHPNTTKALPAASGMALSISKSQLEAAETSVPQPPTETKSLIVEKSKVQEFIELNNSEKDLISNTLAKLLPPVRNHPPIEQFTPEKSDTSETLTSKLKAVIGES